MEQTTYQQVRDVVHSMLVIRRSASEFQTAQVWVPVCAKQIARSSVILESQIMMFGPPLFKLNVSVFVPFWHRFEGPASVPVLKLCSLWYPLETSSIQYQSKLQSRHWETGCGLASPVARENSFFEGTLKVVLSFEGKPI